MARTPTGAGRVCPTCQAQSPSTARFCRSCGTALPLAAVVPQGPIPGSVCPRCGALARQGKRYCQACGLNLTAPDERTGTRMSREAILGLAAAAAVIIAVLVALSSGGGDDGSSTTSLPHVVVEIEPATFAAVNNVAAHLPALEGETDRDQIRSFLGQPDAFVISFEPSGEAADGPIVRYESWYFYELGTVYEFADGALIMGMPSTLPTGPTILPPRHYDPVLFDRDTPLGGIAALLDNPAAFEPIPVEDEYGISLTFYAGEQLLVAFDDEGLFYVETVPLSVDEELGGG